MDTGRKAIAEPRRRDILRLVSPSELPESDIASHFSDVSRSAISQHLGVLRCANLVRERRDGTRRLYRVNDEEMARLRTFLDQYWTGGLDRLKIAAEAAEKRKK